MLFTSTAGHCGDVGTPWWSGNTNSFVGSTSVSYFGTKRPTPSAVVKTDAALIPVLAQRLSLGTTWFGAAATTTNYPVVGFIDDRYDPQYIGRQVNCGGANGGNQLNTLSQVGVNVIIRKPNGTIDTVVHQLNKTTGKSPLPGDSGGACVSSKAGAPGKLYARGQIVAGNPRAVGNTFIPGDTTYYAPINDISAALRASIVLAP